MICFFFFSSRRRHTRFKCDWSSDVCSSDLGSGKGLGRTSVSATAGQAQDQRDLAGRLGIKPGQVVEEIGYDDDCDEQMRDSISAVQDVELVGEDFDDVVDVVLVWWRGRGG